MLYEFRFNYHLMDVMYLLIFVLPFCLWLLSSNFDNRLVRCSVRVLSAIIAVVIIIVLVVFPLHSYFKIKQYIKAGEVLTVEGEVMDFESPDTSWGGHVSESFNIDGTDFIYYGEEDYGYSKFKCDGGVVKGNGQQLKISYCYDPLTGEKVICYIQDSE